MPFQTMQSQKECTTKPLLKVGDILITKMSMEFKRPSQIKVLCISKSNYFLECEVSGDFILDFNSVHNQFLKLSFHTQEIA